jgi:hypothetical protein
LGLQLTVLSFALIRCDSVDASIVGGRHKSKIAEALAQFAQQPRGDRERLPRIERISQADCGSNARHELGDCLALLRG